MPRHGYRQVLALPRPPSQGVGVTAGTHHHSRPSAADECDPAHAEHAHATHGALDPACAVAHGAAAPATAVGTLVAVFASPVAAYLLHFGRDLGYRTVLVEPDRDRLTDGDRRHADLVAELPGPAALDATADLVVTDHHRDELGDLLQAALATPARWIGVIGSPRHPAPHVPALRALGVPEEEIGRIHRPIGLNIGSKSPAEIAISTLAGLIAERNGKPGGFTF